jgi:hypothetical protein
MEKDKTYRLVRITGKSITIQGHVNVYIFSYKHNKRSSHGPNICRYLLGCESEALLLESRY